MISQKHLSSSKLGDCSNSHLNTRISEGIFHLDISCHKIGTENGYNKLKKMSVHEQNRGNEIAVKAVHLTSSVLKRIEYLSEVMGQMDMIK